MVGIRELASPVPHLILDFTRRNSSTSGSHAVQKRGMHICTWPVSTRADN